MGSRALIALLSIAFAAFMPAASTGPHVAVAARSIQPGELVVLTITTPDNVDRVQVRAFGRDIPAYAVDAHEWKALVGVDLDAPLGPHQVTIDTHAGSKTGHVVQSLTVHRHDFPTRTLVVNEAYVNPPAEVTARVEREAAEMAQVYRSSAAERLWTGPFVRPVPGDSVSGFGVRSVFNGQPRNAHGGADFKSAQGTPIKAPNAGRIVVARDLYFSGNTVVIDHGLGFFSVLAHLSAFDVREGETVEAGQIVGRVGATGRVTGPHLHWAVRIGDARVDPLAVLALLGDN